MKRGVVALALAAAILSLSGCGRGNAERGVLYIYNWTYYIPDDVIADFEKEFNAEVVYDVFSSNEDMFAKIKAGGAGYDVVFPGADFASIMISEGMLEPLDHDKIPNLKNLDPAITARMDFDPGNKFAVPYFMGATGIVVNKRVAGEFERSWNIYERADLRNRMTLLDDPREVVGGALRYLGYSVNSVNPAELAKAEV
ncbi:MAG TPA: extracellular solute-binding protein, partial [Magnetospirillaceae bacterium]|nr:extracellular solute-binding protein [Magnetospirillaceae bacterium]